MKYLVTILISLFIANPVLAQTQFVPNLSPTTTDAKSIGTTAKRFLNFFSKFASTTAFTVSGLVSCDTIDTNASGDFVCGTDATGAGGGAYPFTPSTNFNTLVQATSGIPWFQTGLHSSSTSRFVDSIFTNAPIFSSLTGILKGNGSSALTVATNGTDYTLLTSTTCSGTDKISAVTASGGVTCSADQTGGTAGIPNLVYNLVGATNYYNASSSATDNLSWRFANGFLSTASSTLTSALRLSSLSAGGVGIGTGGLVYSGATTTAGTGLTYSGNAFNVNTSQNISTLSNLTGNGAILTSGGAGTLGTYAGTSCTNQFVRSLSGSIVATCATVGASDVSLANLTATDATLTFSGTYNGSTARTIGLNLSNPNTWTVHQIFSSLFATSASTTNATSTNFAITNLLTFNGVTGSTWASFCTTITGGAGLCDGTDATGGAGGDTSKFATSTGSFLSIYPNGGVNTGLGLGTTTPFSALQVGTTTGKNLVLSDTGAGTNLKHWLFSSWGGELVIGTTTDSYGTTTPPAIKIRSASSFLSVGTTAPTSLHNNIVSTHGSLFVGKKDGITTANSTSTFDGNIRVTGVVQAGASVYMDTDGIWSSDGTTALKDSITFSGLSTDTTVGLAGVLCLDGSNILKKMAGAGTCIVSSERFKSDIKTLTASSLDLKTRSFTYNERPDETRYGFIAEEVEKVDKNLVFYGSDGKPFSVHYEDIIALNTLEIQKLRKDVDNFTGKAERDWQTYMIIFLLLYVCYNEFKKKI